MSTTVSTQPPVSLLEHVAPFEAGAHVVALAWCGEALLAGLADGGVLIRSGDETRRVEAHPEAGLNLLRATGEAALTGGDDGRVVLTTPDGATREIARDAKRRWITALALAGSGPKRDIAYAAGKDVTALDAKGRAALLTLPATAEALAFAPKGRRLAIATYNGVSLWYPGTEAKPEFLEWKGSHIGVAWSPDGRFVVSVMQENALHGWRLALGGAKPGHMRMTGYPAKPRSLSWSHDGLWLASSGADAAIVWPFQGDGPMGKAPRECGVRAARVTAVAFHPNAYVLACGYDDGCLLLVRLTDGAELLARPARKGSALGALAWDAPGKRLAYGCDDGAAGVLTLPTG